MTTAQAALIEEVRARFGEKTAITDRDLIAPWESDWRGRYHGHSGAILAPADRDEAVAILGLAHAAGVALTPQGGNTSMVGGATPPADGSALIVTTRRMNRVRSIDAAAGLAIAEAGVILADLNAAAIEAGRRFPLTLGARGSATIGGLISTNAGGNQVLRWGTMRALVAGVEAVLPDGSLYEGLAALKKDNRGYKIDELLIGAEGTLGLVTAATLRLAPGIHARSAAWVALPDPHAALTLLRRFEATTDAVESFELMPDNGLNMLFAVSPHLRSPLADPAPWHVLIEAVSPGPDSEAPEQLLERVLGEALADGLVTDAVIAASEAQVESFWAIRDVLPEGQRKSGAVVAHDISIPVAAMPGFVLATKTVLEKAFDGARVTGFGHLGDGNVHFDVVSPVGADQDAWYAQNAKAVTRLVNDLVVAADGSISAEHGIGQSKLHELERLSSPARLAALRAVKSAFDPDWRMNPGKLVVLAPQRPEL